MEENNEQEKSALEKGVDTTKKVIKNKLKKGIFNLIKPILPYIAIGVGIFFLALLAVGLTMVVQKVVLDTFNSILGITTSASAAEPSKGVITNNIIAAAQEVHDEEMDWIYYTEHPLYKEINKDLNNDGVLQDEEIKNGAASLQADIDKALANPNESTCCATYVSCVLYRAGCFSKEEIESFNINSPVYLDLFLNEAKWERIEDAEEMQPGDILFQEKDGDGNPDHTQIYAGDNMWYNAGGTYYIQSEAPYKDENWESNPKVVSWWAYRSPELSEAYMKTSSSLKDQGLIEIDETGAYKLKEKDLGKKIREELESQKVNNGLMGFVMESEDAGGDEDNVSGDEENLGGLEEETLKELEDMIDKYIKTEIQTTYPRIQDENKLFKSDIDGIITIKRASISDGKVIDLKYVPYEKFKNNLAIDKFSINPKNFKLCLAVREGNGLRLKEFNYQKYVQNYSVPLNFFISLHLISQDADFMNEVVDMVLGKNKENPIELTYVETVNISTTSYNYTGTAEIIKNEPSTDKLDELTTPMIKDQPNGSAEPITKIEEITNDNVREYYEEIKETTTREYYSGELYVTNADTWLKSSGYEIGNVTTIDEWGYNGDEQPVKEEDGVSIKVWPSTTNSKKTFTLTDKESKITVDDFVDLIKKYPKVVDNITSAPSDLFYLLQQSERTQRLERIMRYVIYKLSDVDYGVLGDDLEELLRDIFSKMIEVDIGSIVVKKDEILAVKEVDKEQLEEIITKHFLGKEKDNLLSVINELLAIQEEYNVSPVFAIAVFKVETNCGVNCKVVDDISSYNWANLEEKKYNNFNEATLDFGRYISEKYFSNEKYTITEIGTEFKGEKKSESWINKTADGVIKMYESIGIKVAIEGATELQRKVVEVALNYQEYEVEIEGVKKPIVTNKGYCQQWVAYVYAAAGANPSVRSKASAKLSGYAWGVSGDWDKVPLGACVYGDCGEHGHVGIYIGEGLVAHNAGYLAIDELDYWVAVYSGFCWGWNGGIDLTQQE